MSDTLKRRIKAIYLGLIYAQKPSRSVSVEIIFHILILSTAEKYDSEGKQLKI